MKFLNPIEKPMTANAAWVEIVAYFHDRPYSCHEAKIQWSQKTAERI